MKKIKLMLVALFAMVSTVVLADDYATTTFRYKVLTEPTTTAPGTAQILGFVADYPTASMATVEIPAQVTHPTDATKKYNVKEIFGTAFNGNANIKKVVIKSTTLTGLSASFAKCANLEEIDLTAATGITSVDEGAFVGTKLAKLDLSKTKITTVPALFGTTFPFDKNYSAEEAAAYNAKLTGAVKAGDPTGVKYTETTAAEYNATLDGAVNEGDAKTEAEYYTEAEAIVANQELDGAVFKGTTITADHVTLWNSGYPEDADAIEAGNTFTTLQANAYNHLLAGAKEEGDVKVAAETYSAEEAKAYNAALTGAVAADDDVVYTAETAKAKNATLTGAKTTTDTYVSPAIAYASLTEVILPETWETIDTKAFLNCSALATINFGTPKATVTTHTIGPKAFLGTALKELDFSKLKISGPLAANLLVDGPDGDVKTNATLEKVTLNETITDLNKNFAFCTKLTAIDLTKITNWVVGEFEGSGLTEVTIPAVYATTDKFAAIPANAFKDCTALAKVTFAPVEDGKTRAFTSIGGNAFANTALTAFTVPAELDYKVGATATTGVWDNAFADCAKLTSFTYKPAISTGTVQKVVSDKAFLGCNDGITFYTVVEYAEAAAVNKLAPTHTEFSYEANPAGDDTEAKELTAVKFKNGNNKYFVKYNSMKENIKIKKANAKVYAAYLADDDFTIVMQQFKTKDGYYHIAAGDNVIIITDLEKVPYETSNYESTPSTAINADGTITAANAGKGSSWLASAAFTTPENKLLYIADKDGKKRSVLEAALPGAGYYIFAWSNTTSATGWLKITSGSTFPQKTLYIYAKPTQTAEGARVNVIWLDENGFVEDETTAIQGISTKSENEDGAIYNVAGQKVNASYKGLVIKDGKKYMKK